MQDKQIGIDKFTNFAMKGLVVDDSMVQAYKAITDGYMICFQCAIDKGETRNEAHTIATNILVGQLKSQK